MNDDRKYIIRISIILVAAIFLIKLFFIQVLDENYKAAAESNIIREVIEYPYRGLIFDRKGELLVYNEPIYDLMVIPKEVYIEDTAEFCNLFAITPIEFAERMKKVKSYSSIQASKFIGQISHVRFAEIQDRLIQFKGFYAQVRTVRG